MYWISFCIFGHWHWKFYPYIPSPLVRRCSSASWKELIYFVVSSAKIRHSDFLSCLWLLETTLGCPPTFQSFCRTSLQFHIPNRGLCYCFWLYEQDFSMKIWHSLNYCSALLCNVMPVKRLGREREEKNPYNFEISLSLCRVATNAWIFKSSVLSMKILKYPEV